MDPVRFPIRIGRRSGWIVRLFTATPATAYCELGDDLLIRFGRFRFRTSLSNVATYRIEGPFTWIKAIGVRMSIRHRDVSFCGSAHGAVRMDLNHKQVVRDRVTWTARGQIEQGGAAVEGRCEVTFAGETVTRLQLGAAP